MEKNPLGFYKTELNKTDNFLNALKHRSNIWLTIKIIIFLFGALFVYSGFTKGWFSYGNPYSLIIIFLFYLAAAKSDAKNLDKIEKTRRIKQTLENELKGLAGDYSAFPNGKEYIDPSHEYTYDLDIFGTKSLFQRLNRTITKEGSDRLATLLSNYPADENLIKDRNAAIHELSQDGQELIRFLSSPRQEEDRLRKYIEVLKEKESTETTILKNRPIKFFNRKIVMSLTLLIITWCVLIGAVSGICSWYLFGLLFFIQLIIGFSLSKQTGQMIGETEGLYKSFSAYLTILDFLQKKKEWTTESVTKKQFHSPYLQTISNELNGTDKSLKSLYHIIQAIYCRINDIMFVLMNGLFQFDVFLLRSYKCWKTQVLHNADQWINLLADTDALVSMAVYTFNHPENTDAHFLDTSSPNIIEADNLYHPFLTKEKAVGNDLTLQSTEMMIVTGANMAGKSTFLRTVGINYVMAMNGIPVCAKSFGVKKVALFSSMRTADNLSSNISYFHAELLRLEQLIDFCKHQSHTLIILDEILKGTNSEDKLKGSILFLKKILLLPVTGIVATHDLKLSDLEQEDSHFQNYCFEIGLGKGISYSYKIKKGVARNLNATYLLNDILDKITPRTCN